MSEIATTPSLGQATTGNQSRTLLSFGKVFGLLILIAGDIWMLLPLIWMLSASLIPLSEVIKVPPVWFAPDKYSPANYLEVWTSGGFWRFFLNTAFSICYNHIFTTAHEHNGWFRIRPL